MRDSVKQIMGFKDCPGANGSRRIPAHTYQYHNMFGEPTFQVLRFIPKDFSVRRRVNGVWEYTLPEEERTLYNLHNLIDADSVIVVEGEKDADNLTSLELVDMSGYKYAVTTSPFGALAWLPRYAEELRGRVTVIPDNDENGELYMKAIKKSLRPDIPFRVVRVDEDCKDVSDMISTGRSERIEQLLIETPYIEN